MSRYKSDPRWITARFVSACQCCGQKIKSGDQAFYYPQPKAIYCTADDCGGQRSRDFEAACFDEAQYNGQW